MQYGQLLDNNNINPQSLGGGGFSLNQKFQSGAVAQVQATTTSPMLKPNRLDSENDKDKKLKLPFNTNPRMSKYGQGSFR